MKNTIFLLLLILFGAQTRMLAASISGEIWEDQNNDHLQDDSEPGVPGVIVKLFDDNNVELAADTTDAAGAYSFDNLAAGNYRVFFDVHTAPIGLRKIAQKHAAFLLDKDSDADPDGFTDILNLASASNTITDIDLGLQVSPTALISGMAWQDNNNNDVRDAGDTGIAGISAILQDSAGAIVHITSTDASGQYNFPPAELGKYIVFFDPASFPAGFYPVTPNSGGDDTVDSDANPDGKTDTLQVTGDLANVDIGLSNAPPLVSLSGKVWFDANNNGLYEGTEFGQPNVYVHLLDTSNVILASDTTDTQGDYAFQNVSQGQYFVQFDTASLPPGYVIVQKNVGIDDNIDSDANPDGKTDTLFLDADIANVFMGVYNPPVYGAVNGRAWIDQNYDNTFTFGEPGVTGMNVYLIAQAGDTSMTTATGADGKYAFANVTAGDYRIAFDTSAIPAGYNIVAKDFGTDDSVDSDVDSSGTSDVFSVIAGGTVSFVDMGIAPPVTIPMTTDTLQLQTNAGQSINLCVDTTELPANFVAVQICGQPAHGTLSNMNANCLDYIPDQAYVGQDTFCLLACDNAGNCDSTLVLMNVNDLLNIPPVAVNDLDTVLQGSTKQLQVLSNDTLNAPLQSISIIDYPNLGAAQAQSFGFINYIAEPNVCDDTVSLRYEICTQFGCDTAKVTIYLDCKEIQIFEGFSPNGDGINDFFVIKGISQYPNNKLLVFNRWGNRVFEKDHYDNTWDGYWEDQNVYLPDGTYFYIFETGEGDRLTGSFQIRR